MQNPILEVASLEKRFSKGDTDILALRDFHLSINKGTFVAALGRSGCGKSTLLNMIAGLTPPSSGTIRYAGDIVTKPRSELAYLTQSDTLMPWRTVSRNVEMPLELQRVAKKERRMRAQKAIESVGLAGFEQHYPRELSGGMRRRASLARMLCVQPETLLLDEPFGALDAQLRGEMQAELLQLWEGTSRTVVFVTHDIDEALLLADRVVVLGQLGKHLLDISIDLPRPRDARGDPQMVALYNQLADALSGDVQ